MSNDQNHKSKIFTPWFIGFCIGGVTAAIIKGIITGTSGYVFGGLVSAAITVGSGLLFATIINAVVKASQNNIDSFDIDSISNESSHAEPNEVGDFSSKTDYCISRCKNLIDEYALHNYESSPMWHYVLKNNVVIFLESDRSNIDKIPKSRLTAFCHYILWLRSADLLMSGTYHNREDGTMTSDAKAIYNFFMRQGSFILDAGYVDRDKYDVLSNTVKKRLEELANELNAIRNHSKESSDKVQAQQSAPKAGNASDSQSLNESGRFADNTDSCISYCNDVIDSYVMQNILSCISWVSDLKDSVSDHLKTESEQINSAPLISLVVYCRYILWVKSAELLISESHHLHAGGSLTFGGKALYNFLKLQEDFSLLCGLISLSDIAELTREIKKVIPFLEYADIALNEKSNANNYTDKGDEIIDEDEDEDEDEEDLDNDEDDEDFGNDEYNELYSEFEYDDDGNIIIPCDDSGFDDDFDFEDLDDDFDFDDHDDDELDDDDDELDDDDDELDDDDDELEHDDDDDVIVPLGDCDSNNETTHKIQKEKLKRFSNYCSLVISEYEREFYPILSCKQVLMEDIDDCIEYNASKYSEIISEDKFDFYSRQLILIRAASFLQTGEFHRYRGELNEQGEVLLSIFDKCGQWFSDHNYNTDFDEFRENIMEDIRTVG